MKADEVIVEVQKGIRLFKAFAEAEKIVTFLQNAEQVERETKARVEAAAGELQKLNGELELAGGEIDRAQKRAQSIVADAEAQATEKFEKVNAALREQTAAANATVADAGEKLQAVEAELAQRQQKIHAAAVELEGLQSKIAEAKAQIVKLLGQ